MQISYSPFIRKHSYLDIGTIHAWLPLDGFMCLEQCNRVELEVKIFDIYRFFVRFFFYGFIVFEQKVQFRVDIFSVTSDLTVRCHRVGLEVKIYFYMRTLRASSGGLFVCLFLLLYVPSQQLWSLRDGQFT